MPTRTESAAPAAVSGTSPKMRQLLRRRLRQLVRVTLVLAIGLAVAATALAIWWLTSLNGLPDIGDPFDVEAFRAFSIPDDRNAFTYLRRATEKLTPFRGMLGAEGADSGDVRFSWSIARQCGGDGPSENHEALELFRQAAEQSDAANPAGDPTTDVHPDSLIMLSLLEASRRASGGGWRRAGAVIAPVPPRNPPTSGGGNTSPARLCTGGRTVLLRRLGSPTGQPIEDDRSSQLHAAAPGSRARERAGCDCWDLFAIKSGYLELMSALEQRPIPSSAWQEIEGEWTSRLGGMSLSPEMVEHLEAARRFLLREPERGRRILRLVCANYLAHVEARERPRRKPAVWAMFSYLDSSFPVTKRKIGMPLYPVSSQAPAGALALPPHEVARYNWSRAPKPRLRLIAEGYIRMALASGCILDKAGWFGTAGHTVSIVIMLATEIYRRERGAALPTKPWSGPISRACPTTARPRSMMGRRRPSNSGSGRLDPRGFGRRPGVT